MHSLGLGAAYWQKGYKSQLLEVEHLGTKVKNEGQRGGSKDTPEKLTSQTLQESWSLNIAKCVSRILSVCRSGHLCKKMPLEHMSELQNGAGLGREEGALGGPWVPSYPSCKDQGK